MKHLSAIATVTLAGLSFAPIAAAQWHPDRSQIDRGRPDAVVRAERFAAAERMHVSERGQDGGADRGNASREVAMRSSNAVSPTPETARLGLVGAAMLQRAAARGSTGEDSVSGASHENVAQRSANAAAAQPGGAGAQPQHLGPAGAAMMQRVMARTASAEDSGSSASHANVAAQSPNVAAMHAQAASAQAPSGGMTAAAAIARVMSRTACGEDTGSGASHVNVASHSQNRSQ